MVKIGIYHGNTEGHRAARRQRRKQGQGRVATDSRYVERGWLSQVWIGLALGGRQQPRGVKVCLKLSARRRKRNLRRWPSLLHSVSFFFDRIDELLNCYAFAVTTDEAV
jgi:hypothetical protein